MMKSVDKAYCEGAKQPADSMDTLQQAWLQSFTWNGMYAKQDHGELFITTYTLLLLYIHALAKVC